VLQISARPDIMKIDHVTTFWISYFAPIQEGERVLYGGGPARAAGGRSPPGPVEYYQADLFVRPL